MNKKIAVFLVGALMFIDSANSQNLGENQVKLAESRLDSANQNNPSLRADSQNLCGKPPCKKTQNLQNRLPRSLILARNDEILDSSLRLRYAQNDNVMEIAESSKNNLARSANPCKSFCYFLLL